MAFNDSFGIFGHFSFSSKPTHGRSIFESMSDNMGESYNKDFNSLNSAILYADAMCLASAQYQLDRALNNRDPSKATELLVQLEKDFQVVPGQYDTLKQRRDFLVALSRVSKGNSQSVIESALRTLLGSDFVSYSHLDVEPWGGNIAVIGVFGQPGEQTKQFFLQRNVKTIGVPLLVPYTVIGASTEPMAGETYTVDPDPRKSIEQITIISSDSSYITAVFSRAHESGTIATRPYPLWASDRRYSTVVVSFSIAQNAEKRRKINELMGRAVRGVSQWAIVSDQGDFVLDSSTNGILGSTTLA